MYYTQEELMQYSQESGKSLAEIVLDSEVEDTNTPKEEILNTLRRMVNVMEDSAKEFLDKESVTKMSLVSGYSKKLQAYREKKSLCGDVIINAMAKAFSTVECNATMGRVVAAPTAGSAGIVPAALMTYKDRFGADQDRLVEALLNATAIGHLIGHYGTFAGAEGGCQAECGSASAMASAALVGLQGGTMEQMFTAASISIMNILGMVCDPVGGFVEYPCGFRNASGVVNAMISADMALSGFRCVIPFDQIAVVMGEVGRSLPSSLRETGVGGIAGTPKGQELRDQFIAKCKAEGKRKRRK